jgi:YHS domain-containing protein
MTIFGTIVSFYSPTVAGEEIEYNFCSQKCVDDFIQKRKEFWKIVENFNAE